MAIRKDKKQKKLKTIDIELAIVNSLFKVKQYLVTPNVYYGLYFPYELDMMVVTKAHYAYEIEIKTSKADTIKDKKKKHQHISNRIKYLYFAIPDYGIDWIEHIPDRAGIILIKKKNNGHLYADVFRKPKMNKGCRKLTDQEYMKLGQLNSMRVWKLKKKLKKLTKN